MDSKVKTAKMRGATKKMQAVNLAAKLIEHGLNGNPGFEK